MQQRHVRQRVGPPTVADQPGPGCCVGLTSELLLVHATPWWAAARGPLGDQPGAAYFLSAYSLSVLDFMSTQQPDGRQRRPRRWLARCCAGCACGTPRPRLAPHAGSRWARSRRSPCSGAQLPHLFLYQRRGAQGASHSRGRHQKPTSLRPRRSVERLSALTSLVDHACVRCMH